MRNVAICFTALFVIISIFGHERHGQRFSNRFRGDGHWDRRPVSGQGALNERHLAEIYNLLDVTANRQPAECTLGTP